MTKTKKKTPSKIKPKTKPLSKEAFAQAQSKNKGWANLKPFAKGYTGNPSGQRDYPRKGKSTKGILKFIMETCIPAGVLGPEFEKDIEKIRSLTGKADLSVKEVMLMAQAYKAMQGDTKAFTAILDRLDGKPVQTNVNTERSYEDYLKELSGEAEPQDLDDDEDED